MKMSGTLRVNAVQAAIRHGNRSPRIVGALHAPPTCAPASSYRGLASSHRTVSSSLNLHNNTQDPDERVVRLVMFGKPGAGKGTLSSRLVKKYDLLSVSTGDLLRQQISNGSDIGRQAEEIMARGGLVPDELMLKVATSKLDTLQNKHWILDGFPRTLRQGQLLETHLRKQNSPLTLVINLNVSDDVILSRISDRWIHLPTGRVYNTSYNAPRVAGYDDVTGEPLTKRPDDNPEIFAQRLQSFYASTTPLLAYYEALASQPVFAPTNPHLHPHQLSVHRHAKLSVKTLTGRTSDEIWPELDYIMTSMFPGLKKRSDLLDKRKRDLTEANAVSDSLNAGSFK